MYVKGCFVGYRRGKNVLTDFNNHILKIDGVEDRSDTDFYFGKRVAYIYRCKTERKGSNFRTIWGRITRAHGNSGAVRAKFRNNLPARALGGTVRVMLYPSNV